MLRGGVCDGASTELTVLSLGTGPAGLSPALAAAIKLASGELAVTAGIQLASG